MKDKVNLRELKHGDHNINELIKMFDKYMIKTAISVCGYGDEDLIQDLKQEGSIGLWMAHERYDSTKGSNYHQWLIYGIKQRMLNYMTEKSRTVKIPHSVIFGTDDIDESKVPFLTQGISMDKPIGDDGLKLSDLLADISISDVDVYDENKEVVERLLLGLKPKDIRVLELYYFSGFSIYEIGKIIGCTPQNINDRINRCVGYIQKSMGLPLKKVVKDRRNYRDIQPK